MRAWVWAITDRYGRQHYAVGGGHTGIYRSACMIHIAGAIVLLEVDLLDCDECRTEACAHKLGAGAA